MLKKLTVLFALTGLLAFPGSAWATSRHQLQVAVTNPLEILASLIDRLEGASPAKSKALAHLRLAEAKLQAAESADGPGKVRKLMRAYGREIAKANKLAAKAGLDTAERVNLATSKHLTVLEGLLTKVPEQARGAIQHALEASRRGMERSAAALGKSHGKPGAEQAGAAAGKQGKGKPPWAGQGGRGRNGRGRGAMTP